MDMCCYPDSIRSIDVQMSDCSIEGHVWINNKKGFLSCKRCGIKFKNFVSPSSVTSDEVMKEEEENIKYIPMQQRLSNNLQDAFWYCPGSTVSIYRKDDREVQIIVEGRPQLLDECGAVIYDRMVGGDLPAPLEYLSDDDDIDSLDEAGFVVNNKCVFRYVCRDNTTMLSDNYKDGSSMISSTTCNLDQALGFARTLVSKPEPEWRNIVY